MPIVDEVALFWIFTAIQPCGLLSAWLTRRHSDPRRQVRSERMFWISLILVSLTTAAAMLQGRGTGAYWLFGAATLGAMVLMAVWDCRPVSNAVSQPRWY
jgi:hypothetical protein